MLNHGNKILWSEILKKRDTNPKLAPTKEIKRYKTCLKNAMVCDFRDTKVEKEYAMRYLKKEFPNGKRVKIVQTQRLIEIGFASKPELLEALNKDILMDGQILKRVMLMHESEDYERINISNLSVGDGKDDTELLVHMAMSKYGSIQRIILKYEYGFLLPEAIVIIERNETDIPSEVLINDGMALLDYKNGPKRCHFCKKTNHVYKNCLKRSRRISGREYQHIVNEDSNMSVDLEAEDPPKSDYDKIYVDQDIDMDERNAVNKIPINENRHCDNNKNSSQNLTEKPETPPNLLEEYITNFAPDVNIDSTIINIIEGDESSLSPKHKRKVSSSLPKKLNLIEKKKIDYELQNTIKIRGKEITKQHFGEKCKATKLPKKKLVNPRNTGIQSQEHSGDLNALNINASSISSNDTQC